jgi:hypothetical protein
MGRGRRLWRKGCIFPVVWIGDLWSLNCRVLLHGNGVRIQEAVRIRPAYHLDMLEGEREMEIAQVHCLGDKADVGATS